MSYRDRDRDEPYNRDKGYGRTSFEKKHADAAPKIFIGNIPYTTSDEEVKAHFETCGRVQEVLIPRDPEQRIKGFGFVTFEDFDSMDRAIRKVNGSLVRSKKADKATPDGQTHRQGCCSHRKATTAEGQQGRQNRQTLGLRSNCYRCWS